MENILAPSILSANFADMASDFRILEKGGVKWLHVDVMDGLFCFDFRRNNSPFLGRSCYDA